jgi:hypothetical protein
MESTRTGVDSHEQSWWPLEQHSLQRAQDQHTIDIIVYFAVRGFDGKHRVFLYLKLLDSPQWL